MKRKRFTQDQIHSILKESEAGMPTAEVCRKHGVSQNTFYRWKSKYGGMEPGSVHILSHNQKALHRATV